MLRLRCFLFGLVMCHIVKEVRNTAYCMQMHDGIKLQSFGRTHGKGKLRILQYDVYLNLTADHGSAFA